MTGVGVGVGLGRADPGRPHPRRQRAWRRRLAASRPLEQAYRAGVGFVGTVIVLVGLVTVPLPGPGWLTVLAGLAVLASEFTWAERLLAVARRHVIRWTGWVAAQRPTVRLLLAAATTLLVLGTLLLTMAVVGVPGWLPGWLPGGR
ncbi:TIGR02611 family protein [Blastococcus sp. SYSU DS0828]